MPAKSTPIAQKSFEISKEDLGAYGSLLTATHLLSVSVDVFDVKILEDFSFGAAIGKSYSKILFKGFTGFKSRAAEDGDIAGYAAFGNGGLSAELELYTDDALMATVQVGINATYGFVDVVPSDRQQALLREDLVPINLFPYLRTVTQQITAIAGLAPFTMPIYVRKPIKPGVVLTLGKASRFNPSFPPRPDSGKPKARAVRKARPKVEK